MHVWLFPLTEFRNCSLFAYPITGAEIFVIPACLREIVLWNSLVWLLFLLKQVINSRMKRIIEGMRPNPVIINDGRTWCIVRGLFPWIFLLFQKDSSKCLRISGKVVKSFSTFWLIPVSIKAEIATSKTCWNVIYVKQYHFNSTILLQGGQSAWGLGYVDISSVSGYTQYGL